MFDIHQIQRALEKYYGKKLHGRKNIKISDVTYIREGISHYMYSFHLEYVEKAAKYGENLIIRMGQNRDKLRREFQALEKLCSTSIPVPEVYDMGEDILGLSFIIMEKVEGQNIWKAMGEMTEAEQIELWKQFTKFLTDLHTLDWESSGFDFLDPPEGEYGYIDRWLSVLRGWRRDLEIYGLDPVLDWLEGNKPPCDHYVLLHGDYHPDNVIARNGEIAAIVDWDGVSIGDAGYDVCWPLLLATLIDPSGEWSDRLADSFLSRHKEATGKELRNLGFYQILKACFLLFFALTVKTRGAHELGIKEEAEMLMNPAVMVKTHGVDMDFSGRCAKFIKEKTGITAPLLT